MSTETEVRKASEQFYAALGQMLNGNAAPLADIWSHSPAVTTMHPIGGQEVGWDKVRESWEQVARVSSKGEVRLADQRIQAAGDIAYETGIERGRFSVAGEPVTIEHRVTNVYRRDGGAWKIVHHHTDVSSEMVELLKGLKSGT